MPGGRFARWVAVLAIAGLLFGSLVYILFPAARIDAVIARLLAPQGLVLTPAVHKTVIPGLAWDGPQLASDKGTLVRFDRLALRPQFVPLLSGTFSIAATAGLGTGALNVTCGLNGRRALSLDAKGVSLAEIPFFSTVLGARAAGELWSQGELLRGPQGVSGDVRLEIKRLEFSGVRLGAFALPDAANLTTQGMLRVTNGRLRLESLTLQGDGIYMRLSGDLPSGATAALAPLNLTLEIMPKPEFLERQKLVFLLLARFMASPGVYRVPIRGTLLKPEIV